MSLLHRRFQCACVLMAMAVSLAGAGCDGGSGDGSSGGGGCMTPLVLSFDRAPVSMSWISDDTYFELGQHDPSLTTAWPSAKTPWLARDLDGSGTIDDGGELFGSETELPSGDKAEDGFAALAVLDLDRSGRVDRNEADLGGLLVWRDQNTDRRTEEGELTPAGAEKILWIALPGAYQPTNRRVGPSIAVTPAPRCDPQGNCEVERSGFAYLDEDGYERRGAVVDLHLKAFNRSSTVPPPDDGWDGTGDDFCGK